MLISDLTCWWLSQCLTRTIIVTEYYHHSVSENCGCPVVHPFLATPTMILLPRLCTRCVISALLTNMTQVFFTPQKGKHVMCNRKHQLGCWKLWWVFFTVVTSIVWIKTIVWLIEKIYSWFIYNDMQCEVQD